MHVNARHDKPRGLRSDEHVRTCEDSISLLLFPDFPEFFGRRYIDAPTVTGKYMYRDVAK
eukprot:557609-Rhodomonas_salina.2